MFDEARVNLSEGAGTDRTTVGLISKEKIISFKTYFSMTPQFSPIRVK